MKAIELMQKLGEMVTKHGDFEVRITQERGAADWGAPSTISSVRFVAKDIYGPEHIIIEGGH